MEHLRTRAVVLRRTPYRDHDLIVELLTEDVGRLSALARSGQRSRKRYGGALEIGTRLRVEATRRGAGMATLGDVHVELPINRIRADLGAIGHLCYALEIARLTAREGAPDADLFGLVAGLIERLEATGASAEALLVWELATLAHLGYRLRLDQCVVTGGAPDGLSLSAGGAVALRHARPADASAVPGPALAQLARLARGDPTATIAPAQLVPLRGALAAVWQAITGHPLRSAAFVE